LWWRLTKWITASAGSGCAAFPTRPPTVCRDSSRNLIQPGASSIRTGMDTTGEKRAAIAMTSAFLRGEHELASELLPESDHLIALLKPWLLGTHHGAVSAAHLDYYLNESSSALTAGPRDTAGSSSCAWSNKRSPSKRSPTRASFSVGIGADHVYNRLRSPE
jgi:hypothetical protein